MAWGREAYRTRAGRSRCAVEPGRYKPEQGPYGGVLHMPELLHIMSTIHVNHAMQSMESHQALAFIIKRKILLAFAVDQGSELEARTMTLVGVGCCVYARIAT